MNIDKSDNTRQYQTIRTTAPNDQDNSTERVSPCKRGNDGVAVRGSIRLRHSERGRQVCSG